MVLPNGTLLTGNYGACLHQLEVVTVELRMLQRCRLGGKSKSIWWVCLLAEKCWVNLELKWLWTNYGVCNELYFLG